MSRRKKTLPKLAVIDFETDPFLYDRVPQPFCVEFYADNASAVFWGDDCAKQFAEYAAELPEEYLIYAHNGGKFDFHFLHDYIDNPALIIKSRIVECNLFQHTLRDSFAILPVPLRDFEKMEFDYSLMEREVREQNKDHILEYLHVDCLSLYKAVSAFTDRFGRKMTIGSTAMQDLKSYHKFNNQNSMHDEKFRPYYFGGRVECWQGGILKGPWKLVDRNSMYPSVMKTHRHPINGSFETLEDDMPDDFERPYFITFDGWNDNAIPTRDSEGGLDFSVARGTFLCCSHELEVALKHGLVGIDKIHRCHVANEWTTFDTFVDTHAALKEEAKRSGDILNYVFEKLLMNSAYGRAGINPENFEDWIIHRNFGEENDLEAQGYEQKADYDSIELWSRKAEVKENAYCDVAIAASITSAARASLLEAIQLADDPIYCDTDSIICRDFFGHIDKYELGAWDIEKEAEYAAIGGRKLYALFDKEVHKARAITLKDKARTDYLASGVLKLSSKGGSLSLNEVVRICMGETIEYLNQAPTFSLRGEPKFISRHFRATSDLGDLEDFPHEAS